jgi:putative salt-induced outer membrane protein YdiY
MFARIKIWLAVGCLLAAPVTGVRADVLMLNNGDHLTGKVIKRENGKVYFHSDVFGDIVAPANLVTVVKGTPTATPPESLAGLPPQLPLKAVKPPVVSGAPLPAPAKSGPAPAPSPPQPAGQPIVLTPYAPPRRPWWMIAEPLRILSVFKPWSGKVEFGYDNEVTNVRTVNVSLRAEAELTAGPDSYKVDERYLNGFTGNQATEDQDAADFQWRHKLNERLFTQSLTSFNHDKLQQLHEDLDENIGLGYKVFEGLRQTVDVGAGVIGQYLDMGGYQKGYDTLGNVFEDYTYKINGRYTFTEDASADYSPQERERFGLVNGPTGPMEGVVGRAQNSSYKFDAALQGKISERLSLNLHFEYQYYSAVFNPNARSDQHITTTLGYAF